MLEKDESSRLLGWPLGVSSEVALMDSAPILRAVVEKDEDSNGTQDEDVFKLHFGFSYHCLSIIQIIVDQNRAERNFPES